MASGPPKGTDLSGELKEAKDAVKELSQFITRHVSPLLSKNEKDLELALKSVAPPASEGGKGLKHIMQYISDSVTFIANKMK